MRAIIIRDDQLLVMARNKFGHKYYTLVGGGIDPGETAEEALKREVKEETGLPIGTMKLVLVEEAGQPYGTQYIYWCEYVGGEPSMQSDSDEAKINKLGQNLYQPIWIPITSLVDAPFMSSELKHELINMFKTEYPDKPKYFSSEAKYEEIVE